MRTSRSGAYDNSLPKNITVFYENVVDLSIIGEYVWFCLENISYV